MMSWTHEAGAVATASVVMPLLVNTDNPVVKGVCLASCIIGALVPDVDTPKSKLGIICIPLLWPFYLFQFFCKIFCRKLYDIIGHRGILHWPFTWLVFFTILLLIKPGLINNAIFIGLAIGIFSHLLFDYLSTEGVAVFAPISLKRHHCPISVRTGGILEGLLFLVLLNFIGVQFTGNTGLLNCIVNRVGSYGAMLIKNIVQVCKTTLL